MSSRSPIKVLGDMLSVVKQQHEDANVVLEIFADNSGAVKEIHPPLDVGPIDVTETILFEWEGEWDLGLNFAFWLFDGNPPSPPSSHAVSTAAAVNGEGILAVHQNFTMAYIEWAIGVHERRKELN